LEQIREKGHGGVEIQIPWKMYAKGNISYLSDEWLEMVRFAIRKAAALDLEVAMTFGPGWSFGGFWVPPGERSRVLTQAWVDCGGPGIFDEEVPEFRPTEGLTLGGLRLLDKTFRSEAPDENQIVAVVAGRMEGERLEAASLIDLTERVEGNRLRWQVPDGRWRVMGFRLKYTGQVCQTTDNFECEQWVIDHLSKDAVTNYCDYLGGTFYRAFGEEFGKTVDSLFCDSFEIFCFPQTLLWSTDTLKRFEAYKGYNLRPYLPAIWWDVGELTPRIRYDVNEFLHWLGLDTAFRTFIDWANQHHVQARIQPHYRFFVEIIQGAGVTPRPETEVTTRRFAVVADPRKATAAGAHLYGQEIVSAEAYSFIHMERYRTTLEEEKIAADAFLRDGATQFYNIEYLYSPEMHVAPSRDLPWANRMSHWNTEWKYYGHLAEYISRCCFLLRQGTFVGDVLIYSPQSTVWTQKVLFGNERRVMPYGDLPQTLVANGYDFDPVNDDILQHRARVEAGHIKVRDLSYSFLILPKTTAVPVATMEFIHQFAMGGGVVIALDELPTASTGKDNYRQNDQRVRQLVAEMFGPDGKGRRLAGGGSTYFLPDYKIVGPPFNPQAQPPYAPTPPLVGARAELIAALRQHLPPDFALEGNQQSNGLTFLHRRLGVNDVYFITNLQPYPSRLAATFRVPGKIPEEWDPTTGQIRPIWTYRPHEAGVDVLLDLAPYAATCLMFRPGSSPLYVSETNLERVLDVTPRQVTGVAARNGKVSVTVVEEGKPRSAEVRVSDLPGPFEVTGNWKMLLEGHDFPRVEKTVLKLASWTEDPNTEHFSGTGRYELDFRLPAGFVRKELELVLDLGAVGNIAEVTVNGRNVGVAWMQPYRLPVTEILRRGVNHVTILVTNTLINYVSGLKKLPDVPEDLVPHYGPTAEIYKEGARMSQREIGFRPLPPSGLMGPVRIIPLRKVKLAL
jgi:hypothetical protein